VIVGSLLLILGAVVTLAVGLAIGSNVYLVVSIMASLLAAIAIVAGSRRAGMARAATGEQPTRRRAGYEESPGQATADHGGRRHGRHEAMTEVMPAEVGGADTRAAYEDVAGRRTVLTVGEPAIPAQGGGSGMGRTYYQDPDAQDPDLDRAGQVIDDDDDDDDDDYDDEDPADEPAAQRVSPADAGRVARMRNEVFVIDGRPRYHLMGCGHLNDRESEPLPVHEAIELGFTPCGLCEPDSALIAEARRV
jgi:hypothetical protein